MLSPDDPQFIEMVNKIDLFRGLKTEDVYKIFSKGMTVAAPKGQLIFQKGTVGNNMFVLMGGKLGVFDGERQIATINAGESFGEMSLLCDEPRSATLRALEDSKLFALDERIFQKLLTKRVAVRILLNISRNLAKKLTDANTMIREMDGR
ncbi:MAG: cyclic nucleotide-binding domain-containing protein [Candidatus Hydrogenedentota bacterium]